MSNRTEAQPSVVDIEDPENLSDDFIHRLRDRAHGTSETFQSCPVNLDQVAKRLQDVPANEDRSARRPSPAITEPALSEEEEYREDLRRETEAYNELINTGGRPSHPIDLVEDIVKDPGECREILSFWQGEINPNEGEWRVFRKQLGRWQDFRRLQRYARQRRVMHELILFLAVEGKWESWEEFVERMEQHQQPVRGEWGFPEYVAAVKERLRRNGFTRTFDLEKDPTQQDKLITWIEYLGYECWWYEKSTHCVKRHQRRHDEAWKQLLDSKVLGPEETEEYVCSVDTAYQYANEREGAAEAAESARSAVMSAEIVVCKSHRHKRPEELQQKLVAAQSTVEAAEKWHESIKRRNDLVEAFIQRTMDFQCAESDAERHGILLRWMLQQIPLIELELNPPPFTQNDPKEKGAGKGSLKRRRTDEPDELDEERRLKNQRRDEGASRSIMERRASTTSGFQKSEKRERGGHTPINDEYPSKRSRSTTSLSRCTILNRADPSQSTERGDISRTAVRAVKKRRRDTSPRRTKAILGPFSTASNQLRRSSRIAEREQRLNAMAAAPSDSVKHPNQTIAKLTRMPTPPSSPSPSSIEPKKRKVMPSQTKSTKRGRPKRHRGGDASKSQRISKGRAIL